MAQIRDLLVGGKAKFLGSGTFSGLLDAAGGLKISGASKITSNPTFLYAQNGDTGEVSYINVDDVTVGSAKALSTLTAGGAKQAIYWSNGIPVGMTDSVGATDTPVYLNGGTITALSATVGGTAKPVYLNKGKISALTQTVGGTKKPVYLASGTITASDATVGNDALPMYMSGGEFKTVNIIGTSAGGTGNASFTAGTLIYAETANKLSSNTYALTSGSTITLKRTDTSASRFTATNSNGSVEILASTNRGLYDVTKSQWIIYGNTDGTGTFIPRWGNIGSSKKQLVYFTSTGSAAASDATVGGSTRPVYLNAGTITAVGTIATTYGGTGSNSQTANRVVITDGSGNLVTSTSNHYASGNVIYVNAGTTQSPKDVNDKFLVHGGAQINGQLSLVDTTVDKGAKFVYNSTDKCVDVIFI